MSTENEGGAPEGAEHENTPGAAEAAGGGQPPAQGAEAGEQTPEGEQDGGEQQPKAGGEGAERSESEKPPKRDPQARIDELTKKRRDAEREAEYWKAKALGKDPDKGEGSDGNGAEPAKDANTEPDPADFQYGETDPAYIRALARYEAKQAFAEEAKANQQRSEAKTLERSWNERQQAFAKDKPDYFDLVNDDDLPISPPMADAIRTSDVGPAVAYHLAQNPDEARRIAALTPIAQIREIGRIEAKLATPPAATTPTPRTVSDAPTPPPQTRGQGGRFKVDPATDDFAAFDKAYGS